MKIYTHSLRSLRRFRKVFPCITLMGFPRKSSDNRLATRWKTCSSRVSIRLFDRDLRNRRNIHEYDFLGFLPFGENGKQKDRHLSFAILLFSNFLHFVSPFFSTCIERRKIEEFNNCSHSARRIFEIRTSQYLKLLLQFQFILNWEIKVKKTCSLHFSTLILIFFSKKIYKLEEMLKIKQFKSGKF